MKNILLSTSLLSILALLTSCSGEDPAFGTGSNSDTPSTTSYVSARNFFWLSTKPNLEAIKVDTTTMVTTYTETTAQVTVRVGDRDNFFIGTPTTVYFAVDWGFLSASSCVTEDGICSVTYTTGDFGNMPADEKVSITAYTLGEEEFTDLDNNGALDNGDTFDTANHDSDSPFVDINHDFVYTAGTDIPVGVVPHQNADGKWSGETCNDTNNRCAGSSTTYIYDIDTLDLRKP